MDTDRGRFSPWKELRCSVLSAYCRQLSPHSSVFLLAALASIPSYVPTVAQIMASRSAHTEERERQGDGGRGCARGRGTVGGKGEGGGREKKPTACAEKERGY